ncbi:MAG: ferredoxin family protein [Anaerolineae bacterium]|jgi:ferredoxin--NADP+ reductase
MTYVITEPCIRDGSCAEVCPVECIVAGPEDDPKWGMAYWIDPDTCIDCGACAPECPVDAIYPDDEVPEEYADWAAKNAAFYTEGPGYEAA